MKEPRSPFATVMDCDGGWQFGDGLDCGDGEGDGIGTNSFIDGNGSGTGRGFFTHIEPRNDSGCGNGGYASGNGSCGADYFCLPLELGCLHEEPADDLRVDVMNRMLTLLLRRGR